MTTRAELIEVLQAWTQQQMDEQAVWEWSTRERDAMGERRANDVLVQDILDTLVGLPFDLITTEDALVMLDALDNPVDETDLSVNLLWNHLDMVNTDGRRYELRDHPFYAQFIDGTG